MAAAPGCSPPMRWTNAAAASPTFPPTRSRRSTPSFRRPGRAATRSTFSATPPRERYAARRSGVLADPDRDAVLVMNCPPRSPTASMRPRRWSSRCRPTTTAGPHLLARRDRRGEVAQAVRGQGDADLRDARRGGLRLHASGPISAQPGPAPRDAAGVDPAHPDRDVARATIRKVLADGRTLLTEPEAKAVLDAYGIPTVRTDRRRPGRGRPHRAGIGSPGRPQDPVAARSPTSPTSAASGSISPRPKRRGRRPRDAGGRAASTSPVPASTASPSRRWSIARTRSSSSSASATTHLRPDHAFRPGRHGGRGDRRPGDRPAAAQHRARQGDDRPHAHRQAARRLSRPAAGGPRCGRPDPGPAVAPSGDLPEVVELDINPLLADERASSPSTRGSSLPTRRPVSSRLAIRPYPPS